MAMISAITTKATMPSRRAVLAGALGGLSALAAQALGHPDSSRAEGETIVVGGEYTTAQSRTYLRNQTNDANVLEVASTGNGAAVRGTSSSFVGVYGTSTSYIGLYGTSNSSVGIYGASVTDIGIYGFTSSSSQPGVRGHSSLGNSTGVQGSSGPPPATARAKTGVHGLATQDATSKGVWGESPAGHGVHGSTTSGYAGYFAGKVFTTKFYELAEMSAPAAPGSNKARLFLRDNGSGKTQLCVRFNSGAIQVLSTQP
jgi:hypothetical protein